MHVCAQRRPQPLSIFHSGSTKPTTQQLYDPRHTAAAFALFFFSTYRPSCVRAANCSFQGVLSASAGMYLPPLFSQKPRSLMLRFPYRPIVMRISNT
jgi:hypothetical protein